MSKLEDLKKERDRLLDLVFKAGDISDELKKVVKETWRAFREVELKITIFEGGKNE